MAAYILEKAHNRILNRLDQILAETVSIILLVSAGTSPLHHIGNVRPVRFLRLQDLP